mgnify:CR=1 FL=1
MHKHAYVYTPYTSAKYVSYIIGMQTARSLVIILGRSPVEQVADAIHTDTLFIKEHITHSPLLLYLILSFAAMWPGFGERQNALDPLSFLAHAGPGTRALH